MSRNRSCPLIAVALFVAMLFAPGVAYSAGNDEVLLKEGGVVTGKIVEETPQKVIVEIPFGTLQIPMSDIKEIRRGVAEPPPRKESPLVTTKPAIKKERPPVEETPAGRSEGAVVADSVKEAVDAIISSFFKGTIPQEEFFSKIVKLDGEAVPYLISLLKSNDKSLPKDEITRVLGTMKARDAVGAIATVFKSEEPRSRAIAANALKQIGGIEVIRPLAAALNDTENSVALNIVEALISLHESDPDLSKWILNQMRDTATVGEDIVKARAAAVLGRMNTPESIDVLVRMVGSDRGEARLMAIRYLGLSNTAAAVEALIGCLGGDDPEAVKEACGSLGMVKDRNAIPTLIELLQQRENGVAEKAFFALKAITKNNFGMDHATWKHWWENIASPQNQ